MDVKDVLKYRYTVDSVKSDLGGIPGKEKLDRLIENYPSYTREHRYALLEGIRDGADPLVMVESKLQAKGIKDVTKQGKGGHARWVTSKLFRFTVRVLYLDYRIDNGLTKRQANAAILKRLSVLSEADNYESAKRIIRKHTAHAKLDS